MEKNTELTPKQCIVAIANDLKARIVGLNYVHTMDQNATVEVPVALYNDIVLTFKRTYGNLITCAGVIQDEVPNSDEEKPVPDDPVVEVVEVGEIPAEEVPPTSEENIIDLPVEQNTENE